MSTEKPFARDLETVREILLWMELGAPRDQRPCPGDDAKFNQHCSIMKDAALIEATITAVPSRVGSMPTAGRAAVTKICPLGYDFLAAAREPKTWNKIKEALVEHGLPVILELVVSSGRSYLQKAGVPFI